jgi:hypothetical protein
MSLKSDLEQNINPLLLFVGEKGRDSVALRAEAEELARVLKRFEDFEAVGRNLTPEYKEEYSSCVRLLQETTHKLYLALSISAEDASYNEYFND